ncbi:PREDICTED: vesicle-associated protein 1-4-like [Erythranthe guttata]|uniref:vesicle-associated protein 1-4-like n=1 Tax=Erythranthe guttata TaxID=4155 RepID=UPI00064DEF1C|nr:PREDICTED: vesicle-associated protein 1-4-like [Erythranthe guttata]|eukprot:XP_012841022.1 PREDICTED: vesicle-associated protein 1-4-like [Erythranthe guttata]
MEKLLIIEPQHLNFTYEPNKESSSSIRLSNKTDQHVAFKVMTTTPKNYCVLPNIGVVSPGSSCDVSVKMIGPTALPTEGKCSDIFLINTVVASSGATPVDAIKKLFDKEAGLQIQECKLGVIYTFSEMGVSKLVEINPSEFKFDFKLRKALSCSLKLSNITDTCVFFNVKTTDSKKYCVLPNTGIVLPRSTCDVIVRMKAQNEIPQETQCKDKFLIQCTAGNPSATIKDVTPEMFNKEVRSVEEYQLGVVYNFALQEGPLNYIPQVIRGFIASSLGSLLMKGVATSLLGLILSYLVMKILPQIWYVNRVYTNAPNIITTRFALKACLID